MSAVLRGIGLLVVRHDYVHTALDIAFRIGCGEAHVIYAAIALAGRHEGVWATAGYLAGDRLDDIFAAAFRYQWLALAVLLVLGGGYAVLHVRRRRARTRQETG